MPLTPFLVLILSGLLVLLFVLIQIDVLSFAFTKLGLSPGTGILVLFGSLLGSAVNIPLFTLRAGEAPVSPKRLDPLQGLLRGFDGRIVIAVNLGGCLIPVGVSLYLLHIHDLPPGSVLMGVAGVACVSYFSSRPVSGVGIGMPLFVAPLASVLLALLLYPPLAAPLAYISGTLGVLIGADLLHLRAVRQLGAPVASIGGAGTFDGIFFTGVLAALLV